MVAPVLSFTGSPTESAAAAAPPAVALVSEAEPDVDGAVEVLGAVDCVLGLDDCIGASVGGMFEVAGWLAAKAGADIAAAIPTAIKRAERMWILPGFVPNPSPNDPPAKIVPK
jgi:hypothetical protein